MSRSKDFSIIAEQQDGLLTVRAVLKGAEVNACAGALATYLRVKSRKALRRLQEALHAYQQHTKAPQVASVLAAVLATLDEVLSTLVPQQLSEQVTLPVRTPLRCRPHVLLNAPNA